MAEFIKKDLKSAGSCTDCSCKEKECRREAAPKSEAQGSKEGTHKEKEALNERSRLKN